MQTQSNKANRDSHNVCMLSLGLAPERPSPLKIILPPVSGVFTLCPVYVYAASHFVGISIATGGLIHRFDAAYLLGKDRVRIHQLVRSFRFTVYRFPFGEFLSVREVSTFTPLRPGRPKLSVVAEPEATIRVIQNLEKQKTKREKKK